MFNKIRTLSGMKEYILSKLGEPVLTVDIDDYQLNIAISDAIQTFAEVALEGQMEKTLVLDIVPGVTEYLIDDKIRSIVDVVTSDKGGLMTSLQVHGQLVTKSEFFGTPASPMSGSNFDLTSMSAMLSKFSAIENMFSITPNYSYSSATNILSFTEDVGKDYPKVLLHCYSYYDVNTKNDGIFNHQWVKSYAVALSKIQWGNNIGKFDATLIGGEKVNYDRLINEGTVEKDKLEEELYSIWSEPLGIYRG